MTRLEKIQRLIKYEIEWAIENASMTDAQDIMLYIVALFESYSDSEIDRQYKVKFEEI